MPDVIHAFTLKSTVVLKQLRSEVYVQNALQSVDSSDSSSDVQLEKLTAVWDTGAVSSCISESLAVRMGLTPVSRVQLHGVDGPVIKNRYVVNLILPNKVRFVNVPVNSGTFTDFEVLIGMDIISSGDFAVSNHNGQTTFTYQHPSNGEIDFVKKINVAKAIGPKHGHGKKNKKKR